MKNHSWKEHLLMLGLLVSVTLNSKLSRELQGKARKAHDSAPQPVHDHPVNVYPGALSL